MGKRGRKSFEDSSKEQQLKVYEKYKTLYNKHKEKYALNVMYSFNAFKTVYISDLRVAKQLKESGKKGAVSVMKNMVKDEELKTHDQVTHMIEHYKDAVRRAKRNKNGASEIDRFLITHDKLKASDIRSRSPYYCEIENYLNNCGSFKEVFGSPAD